MDLLKNNYIIIFFIILLCVLMSKYIVTNTNKEMFKVINFNRKINNVNQKKD
jgi:hypothetical protein